MAPGSKGEDIGRDPEMLKDILSRYLRQIGLDLSVHYFQIATVWNEHVESKIRQHARPVGFRNQVVEVVVDSSAHYFELLNFRKRDLLELLQQYCPEIGIQDIHFVCGGSSSDSP